MKYILSILSILCLSFIEAQNINLSSKIIDEQAQPIPIATAFLKANQVANTSDFEGNFKLVFSSSSLPDTLIIRHISYETKKIYIDKNNINSLDNIVLKTKENEIGTAVITASSAQQIIKKAILAIPNNYSKEHYYLDGFYRQAHKENNKYVRLIECFAQVKEDPTNRNSTVQKEQFRIEDIRRSNVYERNGDQHGDHFVDLFSEDPILYAYSSFLNEQAYRQYDFSFGDSPKTHLIKIFFQNKSWTETQNKSGYVLINRSDYAIVEMEITSTQNPLDKNYNKSNWKFQNGTYKVQYKKQEGKYFCNRSSKYYNHYVLNEFTKNVEYVVEEYFDWWSHKVIIDHLNKSNPVFNDTLTLVDTKGNIDIRIEPITFKPLTNLYSLDYFYRGGWDNWIPKLNQRIIDDLNRFMDLEKQFKDD